MKVRRLSRKPRVRPRREKSPGRRKRRAEQAWDVPLSLCDVPESHVDESHGTDQGTRRPVIFEPR